MSSTKRKVANLEDRLSGNRQRNANDTNNEERDPKRPTRMVVTIDDLMPYDKNPRRKKNPLYAEIKASIQARGLDHPPNITRRPEEAPDGPYMVKDGGNTRLSILKELYEETGDRQYYSIDCMFHPWVSEADAIAGHLIENDMRGGMILIDRARGAMEWMEYLGDQANSIRKASEAMTAAGWKIDNSNLGVLIYALKELYEFIPTTLDEGAGVPLVKEIRNLYRTVTRFWQSIEDEGPAPTAELQQIWIETLKSHNDPKFNMASFRSQVEQEIAKAFDLDVSVVQTEIYLIQQGDKPSGVRPPKVDFSQPATMPPRPPAAPGKSANRTSTTKTAGTEHAVVVDADTEDDVTHTTAPQENPALAPNEPAPVASPTAATMATSDSQQISEEASEEEQLQMPGLTVSQAPVQPSAPPVSSRTITDVQNACYQVANRIANLVQLPDIAVSMAQLGHPGIGFGFQLVFPTANTLSDHQRAAFIYLFYCFYHCEAETTLPFGFPEIIALFQANDSKILWEYSLYLLKLRQHESMATGDASIERQLVLLFDEMDQLIAQLRVKTDDDLTVLWAQGGHHG